MRLHTFTAALRPASVLPIVLACAGDYPLGKLDNPAPLTDDTTVARHGTSGLIGLPDETLSLEDENGTAVEGVTAIGDFDGDGFADLMGAGQDEATHQPFVQLRYGGPRAAPGTGILPFGTRGARLFLPEAYQGAPRPIPVGDVDGDGYADILILTVQCTSSVRLGSYLLLYGGPERFSGGAPLVADAVFLTLPQHLRRGCQTALDGASGDLDGDGFSDLVLNTPYQLDYADPTSRGVRVFYGGPQRFSGELSFADADARLSYSEDVRLYVAPDLNGDGRADLLLGKNAVNYGADPGLTFFFPGDSRRLSGELDVETSAVRLDAELLQRTDIGPLDLDGDGMNEVILAGHLFYGAPGLFANGLDLSQASAIVESDLNSLLTSAGDRDGDGDSELLEVFRHYGDLYSNDAALLSGAQERLSGTISVPGAGSGPRQQFPDDRARVLDTALAAGDLDGDGLGDLIVHSSHVVTIKGSGDLQGTDLNAPQLHIYYGVPALGPVH